MPTTKSVCGGGGGGKKVLDNIQKIQKSSTSPPPTNKPIFLAHFPQRIIMLSIIDHSFNE